jgi:hypothetical protein
MRIASVFEHCTGLSTLRFNSVFGDASRQFSSCLLTDLVRQLDLELARAEQSKHYATPSDNFFARACQQGSVHRECSGGNGVHNRHVFARSSKTMPEM